MNRNWKRVVSMLLIGTMATQGFAFATEGSVDETAEISVEDTIASLNQQRFDDFAAGKTLRDEVLTTIKEEEGCVVSLRGYEYSNHDVCNQLIVNGVVTGESYLGNL